MIHFAYPNVIPRESRFLGCGRYVAALLGESPDESYKLVELNIPNITEVHLAALQLAPEAVDSKKVIYERRDASSQTYLGESRDFAYVLALISRSRAICLSEDRIRGDIWCTGCIDIKGENRPFLKAVDVSGFSCKLEAFLSEESPDRLFLVPAQNVLPTHEVLFQKSDVNVVSLKQFQQNLSAVQEIFEKKTIVKIQGDELERLVNVLFEIPELKQKAPHPVIGINPYRGLFAFQEQDAEFFFGRELYTKRLVEAVRNKPFVAVIGPSGIGKSSVVNAGLIPQLRHQKILSWEGQGWVNSSWEEQGWVNWLIATFRPGTDPFRALASALLPLLEPEKSEVEQLVENKRMTKNLKSGHLNLEDILEAILSKNPDSQLLLCADQFEELYTLCREEDERHRFLDELLSVLPISPSSHPSIFSLVLTMRADFLGKAFSYRPFADALQDASLILGPMNREELREVIEKPAKKCGIHIEDGLTDRILEAISGEPGHLPLLEFALTQLWEKQTQSPSTYGILSHAAYDDIGGVEQALACYAERVYESLTWQEQRQTQQIFTQLVHPGEGTEDTRRTATRSDVGEGNWELVTKLADARLVVTNSPPFLKGGQGGFDTTMGEILPPLEKGGIEETVEVVHEALIQGWQRLHKWIENDREFRTWQERLRTAIHQWKESNYDEGALLRGVPLGEAEDWLGKKGDSLSHDEYDFIESSLQARKRLKRRYQIGIMTGFVISIVIALFFMALWNNAETQRRVAEIAAIKARIQTSHALFLSKEDDLGALLVGIKAGKNSNRVVLPTKLKNQMLFNLREVVCGIHEKNRLEGHESGVKSVSFSPDGRILASGSNDHTIKLWNVADGQEFMILQGHWGAVKSIDFSPDGRLLASGSSDMTIKLWDVAEGRELMTLQGHPKIVRSVSFSPDGKLLASGSEDTTIKVWDVAEGRELMTLQGHAGTVWSVNFSSDGKLLASGSEDTTIKVWDVAEGRELMTLQGHSGAVRSVNFSPDGKLLASGSNDKTIKFWDVAEGRERMTLLGHSDTVRSVNFSPDGKLLVSGSDEFDCSVRLWNVADGREINLFKGHYNSTVSVHFSPDGELLASGSDDYTVKLWDITNDNTLTTLYTSGDNITSVAFNSDGTLLALGDYRPMITVWDIKNNSEFMSFQGHSQAIRCISFSPDGTLLASGSSDNTIKIWNMADGQELLTLHGHESVVRSVSFNPAGTLLASGGNDRTIKLWNIADGQEVMTLRGHSDNIRDVKFSPDGTLLASGSEDMTVKLWNIADGRELITLRKHFDAVRCLSFSPNGTLLASGSGDNTVKLWKVSNRSEFRTLKGHSRTLLAIDFSPDGTLLASGSQDRTVKFWNVADGSEITTLYGHAGAVNSVDFSPKGTVLVSGSDDNTVKMWNFNLDDLLVRGCEKLHSYLKNNPNVSDEDRSLCDDIID